MPPAPLPLAAADAGQSTCALPSTQPLAAAAAAGRLQELDALRHTLAGLLASLQTERDVARLAADATARAQHGRGA